MPNFGSTSKYKLSTCHSELQLLFSTVVDTFDCSVLEGHRGQADQEKAFNEGKSKLNWPLSKHNSYPSLAVDVSPYPIKWEDLHRFCYFAGYVLGIADQLHAQGMMKHKVRWGGDWNQNHDTSDEKGLADLVHFELVS